MLNKKKIFFDTDCISAFLWCDKGNIVLELFAGLVVIPQSVVDEINKVADTSFRQHFEALKESDRVEIWDFEVFTSEYELYKELTSGLKKQIGRGEAATIALAKTHRGVVASNNLRDIAEYIRRYHLAHITTAEILIEAYENGLIDEKEGNAIWSEMQQTGSWLGADSFSEYLNCKPRKPIN